MYQSNGTYYAETHSVSFGEVSNGRFVRKANSWADWHLIPSSRPVVAPPSIITKYVEVPGSDEVLDLSTYLTGSVNYGQRSGSFSFMVDNGHEYWETIREKMVGVLHGKRLKMRLEDDPTHYYDGRFTVGNWETGADRSAITISYQLEPTMGTL